jgi:hypothetical protein
MSPILTNESNLCYELSRLIRSINWTHSSKLAKVAVIHHHLKVSKILNFKFQNQKNLNLNLDVKLKFLKFLKIYIFF